MKIVNPREGRDENVLCKSKIPNIIGNTIMYFKYKIIFEIQK